MSDAQRWTLATNYRCGQSCEEMEKADEWGEWVKAEDYDLLREENARLTQERDEASRRADVEADGALEANDRWGAAEGRIVALRAALATYGQHKRGCASKWRAATGSSEIGPCDCGLDAALTPGGGK